MADQLLIPITADVDVVTARQRGRDLAAEAGFSSGDQTVIAAAISEIARNILMYAKRGEIALSLVANGDRQGVVVVARDQGPGIRDVPRALQDGYSTSGGLGLGLPGTEAPGRLRRGFRCGEGNHCDDEKMAAHECVRHPWTPRL